jgi:hypothetical protein
VGYIEVDTSIQHITQTSIGVSGIEVVGKYLKRCSCLFGGWISTGTKKCNIDLLLRLVIVEEKYYSAGNYD